MIQRFGLRPSSNVIEVASNDGYLLQYFVRRGIPVLGIEPAANVASVATERGIPTVVEFLGADTARRIIGDTGGRISWQPITLSPTSRTSTISSEG